MKLMNLTDSQKNVLTTIVNLVRSGELQEEFTIVWGYYDNKYSMDILDFDGDPPDIPQSVIDILEAEQIISVKRSDRSARIALRKKAFDVVDANFQEPDQLHMPPSIRNYGNLILGDNSGNIKQVFQRNQNQAEVFNQLIKMVGYKADYLQDPLHEAIHTLEEEASKGEQADENLSQKRIKFLLSIAPDIGEIAIASFINPIYGFAVVFKKIAERARQDIEAKK